MPTDAPFPPAYVPDGFSVVRHLGAGQTSYVYLAEHASLGRVALKLPRETVMRDATLRRMFENEVQITLKLSHENIVRAHVGNPTGRTAHLVLEFCAGGTLDQRLLEVGRMSIEATVDLILDIARGVRHSHAKSVLHRDIKPANVFLDADGRAKLGDFGTGVFMAEENTDRVGTAFYMAPEIFEGARASVQSDVYSLGVLAYELLTGRRPFLGSSFEELMIKHLKEVPRSPRSLRSDLPRGVTSVVLRAMNRDASKRYDSVAAFIRDLQQAMGRETAEQVPDRPDDDAPATGRASRRRSSAATPDTATADREDAADEDAPEDDSGRSGGLFGWLRGGRRGDD